MFKKNTLNTDSQLLAKSSKQLMFPLPVAVTTRIMKHLSLDSKVYNVGFSPQERNACHHLEKNIWPYRNFTHIHPWRLTWNIIMEVWKIIFLSKWVICRFHVNLPGCTLDHIQTPCWGSVFLDQTKICPIKHRENSLTQELWRFGGRRPGYPNLEPRRTRPTNWPHLGDTKITQNGIICFGEEDVPERSTGWWLNQPIWKICSSNWKSSTIFGVKIKHLWNHRLEDRLLAEVLGRCCFFNTRRTVGHHFGKHEKTKSITLVGKKQQVEYRSWYYPNLKVNSQGPLKKQWLELMNFLLGQFGPIFQRCFTRWLHVGKVYIIWQVLNPRAIGVLRIFLQGINISHLGKRKIIFKTALERDMLVPRRVFLQIFDFFCFTPKKIAVRYSKFRCDSNKLPLDAPNGNGTIYYKPGY